MCVDASAWFVGGEGGLGGGLDADIACMTFEESAVASVESFEVVVAHGAVGVDGVPASD